MSPVSIFAMPKSKTLTCPVVVSIRFDGFRSRWTMPAAWAACEGVGDLRDDAGDLGNRHRRAAETVRQGFPLVVRHGDERLAVVVADLVDRRDVWMIERTSGPRLSQQAGRGVWTARGLRVQKLQRDSPLESRILREIDRAHAARADVADDPVVGDAGADHPRILLP